MIEILNQISINEIGQFINIVNNYACNILLLLLTLFLYLTPSMLVSRCEFSKKTIWFIIINVFFSWIVIVWAILLIIVLTQSKS